MKKEPKLKLDKTLVCACDIASERITAFATGRKSVADEDRLLQDLQKIPATILVEVFGYTTDSIGDRKQIECKLRKKEQDKWVVEAHWYYETGAAISDKMAQHSIICALSGPGRSQIVCSLPHPN